ncbi:proteoglycan 4-like [Penaeus japonicus]|uniref:proteoglycan 4-like n=1 Tax=Penaeus japonicus TaxID=27405 RepID=UPI001C7147F8|nr:proteoglycan 4-like [Penaeus japonicus]
MSVHMSTRVRVPTTPSNDPIKRPHQTTPSNNPIKRPHQTTPSNDPIKQPHQTTPSNDPIKRPHQTTPSNDPNQTTQSNDPIKRPNQTTPIKRPHQTTPSNDPIKRPNQTTPSNNPIKRPHQTTPSNNPIKRPHQTTQSNNPIKQPQSNNPIKRPHQTTPPDDPSRNARQNDTARGVRVPGGTRAQERTSVNEVQPRRASCDDPVIDVRNSRFRDVSETVRSRSPSQRRGSGAVEVSGVVGTGMTTGCTARLTQDFITRPRIIEENLMNACRSLGRMTWMSLIQDLKIEAPTFPETRTRLVYSLQHGLNREILVFIKGNIFPSFFKTKAETHDSGSKTLWRM